MLKSICYIIFFITFLRGVLYQGRITQGRKNFLLMSALIQMLMFNPVTILNYGMDEEIVLPFGSSVGLFFPSIIAMIIFAMNQGRKYTFSIGHVTYTLLALLLAIIISYSSPYNLNVKATNVAWLIIVQIILTMYICRKYISYNIMRASVYDAFQIIILVQFIVSLAAILGMYELQDMFLGNEKDSLSFTNSRPGVLLLIPSGTTPHHNMLGGLCAFISIFYFACVIYEYKIKKSRNLLILSVIMLVLSQSRGAIISFLVAMVFLYVVNNYKKKQLSLSRLLLINIGIVISLLFLWNNSFFRSLFVDSDFVEMAYSRNIHYLMGLEILSKTHLQGIGLNTHLYYMQMLRDNGFSAWAYTRPIHNMHLVIFVELGIIGVITWLYFYFSRIIIFVKSRDEQMNCPVICATFCGMLIIILIHGMVDVFYFRYQFLMLLFMFGFFSRNITSRNMRNKT